jgi:hypothetical protein
MSLTKTDLYEIQATVAPLLRHKAWNVSLGVGSFITLEFGEPLPLGEQDKRIHGEWHLWVYMCAWRLEKNNEFIAGCEDPRDQLIEDVKLMEGLAIKSIEILAPACDTIIHFEDEVILRLFSIYSKENEHWMLFAPDGNVLVMGPGTSWSYESSL